MITVAALKFSNVICRGIPRSNENKMSDGGRGCASLGMNGWRSSQKWSARRSAVRSIAWLGRTLKEVSSWYFSRENALVELECLLLKRVRLSFVISRDAALTEKGF
jgi:hypothetical protein